MDPRNFLSLVVLLGSLRAGVGDDFTPELYYNTDVTSLLLSKDGGAVYIDDEIQHHLDKERLSACRTDETSHQDRTISLMTTISAAGALLCTIAVITDSNNAALEIIKV